jgi:predicted metal-dependent peptidase
MENEKISYCKTQMLLRQPWWATMLLHLRVMESSSISTMGTDGTYLLYNKKFLDSLTVEETIGVLAHEVAHCILLHPFRRQWREPKRWNIAADAAVNALLTDFVLPEGSIPAAPLHMTAEELYESAPDLPNFIMDVYGPGDFGAASSIDAGGSGSDAQLEPPDAQLTADDWREALVSARGLQPATLDRVIDSALAPVVNWREVLAQFILSTVKGFSHTWQRPSRRITNYPGWRKEPQLDVAIVIDTSGSISSTVVSHFLAEAKAIVNIAGVRAHLLSADAVVHQVIEPGSEWPLALKGGGGTDFGPAIEAVSAFSPSCCVYLTDGDGSFPAEPDFPVLWALTSKAAGCPWGHVVYL